MSVRRLAPAAIQPASFAFSAANDDWASGQIAKYPAGRQASAVIPLLWRAQEQEGWVSEAAITAIAQRLDMPKIRVLEVATFYTMFNLEPVGRFFVQLCGTVPCHLRGAEELKEICRRVIGPERKVTADGALSWLEVECLGACVNAPMAQVNADYYEDLTPERLEWLLAEFRAGRAPPPGPQNGRQFSAPEGGDTTLTDPEIYQGVSESGTAGPTAEALTDAGGKRPTAAASQRDQPAPGTAVEREVRRDGAALGDAAPQTAPEPPPAPADTPSLPSKDGAVPATDVGASAQSDATLMGGPHPPQGGDVARGAPSRSPETAVPEGGAASGSRSLATDDARRDGPDDGGGKEELARAEEQAIAAKLARLPANATAEQKADAVGQRPAALGQARGGTKDKLQRIRGIGPVNEGKLNALGVYHFDQIAQWTREEIRWVGTYLSFPGRIDREDWTGQARILAAGGDTGAKRPGRS